jgi:hypothetical protein
LDAAESHGVVTVVGDVDLGNEPAAALLSSIGVRRTGGSLELRRPSG